MEDNDLDVRGKIIPLQLCIAIQKGELRPLIEQITKPPIHPKPEVPRDVQEAKIAAA